MRSYTRLGQRRTSRRAGNHPRLSPPIRGATRESHIELPDSSVPSRLYCATGPNPMIAGGDPILIEGARGCRWATHTLWLQVRNSTGRIRWIGVTVGHSMRDLPPGTLIICGVTRIPIGRLESVQLPDDGLLSRRHQLDLAIYEPLIDSTEISGHVGCGPYRVEPDAILPIPRRSQRCWRDPQWCIPVRIIARSRILEARLVARQSQRFAPPPVGYWLWDVLRLEVTRGGRIENGDSGCPILAWSEDQLVGMLLGGDTDGSGTIGAALAFELIIARISSMGYRVLGVK